MRIEIKDKIIERLYKMGLVNSPISIEVFHDDKYSYTCIYCRNIRLTFQYVKLDKNYSIYLENKIDKIIIMKHNVKSTDLYKTFYDLVKRIY